MKKNLTKIIMLALTLCMMIAMFAVVASAEAPDAAASLENTTVAYNGKNQIPVIHVYEDGAWGTADWANVKVNGVAYDADTCKFTEAGLYLLEVAVDGKVYTLRYEITKITPVFTLGGGGVAANLTYTGEKATGFWSGTSKYIDVNGNSVSRGSKAENAVITMTYYVASEYAADPATAQPVIPVDVGTYTIVMTSAETNNLNASEKVFAKAIKINPKEIVVDAVLDKTYGEADPKIEMPAGALFGDDVVEIVYNRVDNENVDVYDITLGLVGADAANYKVVPAGEATLTINKIAVTIVVGEHTITYGDELVLNNYSFKNGVGFFAEDGIEVVLSPIDLAAQVGTYYLEAEAVGAAAANYEVDYDYENAILVLVPRVLTADDFVLDNNTFVYNGQLQLPNVLLVDGALGAFGDEECELDVIGSARKYGGTYYVTVVGLKTENYVLADDVRLEYTILAEGEKNSNDAVVEFLAGVVNAGQIVGEVVEVVAPVVNAIGKVIVDGIKNGVSALFNDFFGRVFG